MPGGARSLRQLKANEARGGKHPFPRRLQQKRPELEAVLHAREYHKKSGQQGDVEKSEQQNSRGQAQARFHSAPSAPRRRIMYPALRMVTMNLGDFGSSPSFFLTDEIWTSMERSKTSKLRSATSSSNCSRDFTRPADLARASSRSNSMAVSDSGSAPSRATRDAGSMMRSPTAIFGAGFLAEVRARMERRMTARRRARSSRVENVLGR